ncbi:MAG TPA: hypothetical protein VFP20_11705 [Bacteroidales bacterium]|nr:hypothetical protein [Bacteroidales bacterium]
MLKKIYNIFFIVGAILILISSVMVMEHVTYSKYLFAVGVAMYIVSRMRSNYEGDDFRLKRLNRLYFLSSLFMLGASYMQFKNLNSWVAVLLMSALTELYVAVRFSWYEKENKAKDQEDQKPSE